MKRAPISLTSLASISLALVLALPLAGQTLETRSAQGATTLLQKSSAGWQVDAGQGPVALPVSPGVHFTALRSAGPAFVAAGVERAGQGIALVLVRGQGTSFEVLPAPQIPAGEFAMLPAPVLGPAGLEALLWIEGKDQQSGAVKFAAWNGSAFVNPVTIAPPGPGTQTALQVLRLADGSWLAVWSAFDGQDDEILWSRGSAQGWSPAKAMTANSVPDVTPALRQTRGGALMVWSFYDGNDYRLRSARFADWSWTDGEVFGGKGASYPAFAETSGATVVFRQVEPEAWRVVELKDDAKVGRQVDIPTATRRPPTILAIDDKAVTIEWSTTDAGKTPVSIVVPWEAKKN